ncbi:MAG: hypothetical protein AB1696_05185 [Planctomycetota bacterium]
MPIEFKCHNCGGKLSVASEHGGRHGRCPFCRKLLKAPESAPAVDQLVGEATEEITASILEEAAEDAFPPMPPPEPPKIEPEPVAVGDTSKKPKPAPKKKAAAPPPPPKGGKGGINFECLLCGEKISVAKEMAGKKITCHGCDNQLTVPSS